MKISIRITNQRKRSSVIQLEPNTQIKSLITGDVIVIELTKRREGEPFDIILDEDAVVLNENNDVFCDIVESK